MSIHFQQPPQLRSHGFSFGKSEVNSGYVIKRRSTQRTEMAATAAAARKRASRASIEFWNIPFSSEKSATPLQSARPRLEASVGLNGQTLPLSIQLHCWMCLAETTAACSNVE